MHAVSMGAPGILAAKKRLKPLKEPCTVKKKKKKSSKTQKTAFHVTKKLFYTQKLHFILI